VPCEAESNVFADVLEHAVNLGESPQTSNAR
jgi:hypothetical protein